MIPDFPRRSLAFASAAAPTASVSSGADDISDFYLAMKHRSESSDFSDPPPIPSLTETERGLRLCAHAEDEGYITPAAPPFDAAALHTLTRYFAAALATPVREYDLIDLAPHIVHRWQAALKFPHEECAQLLERIRNILRRQAFVREAGRDDTARLAVSTHDIIVMRALQRHPGLLDDDDRSWDLPALSPLRNVLQRLDEYHQHMSQDRNIVFAGTPAELMERAHHDLPWCNDPSGRIQTLARQLETLDGTMLAVDKNFRALDFNRGVCQGAAALLGFDQDGALQIIPLVKGVIEFLRDTSGERPYELLPGRYQILRAKPQALRMGSGRALPSATLLQELPARTQHPIAFTPLKCTAFSDYARETVLPFEPPGYFRTHPSLTIGQSTERFAVDVPVKMGRVLGEPSILAVIALHRDPDGKIFAALWPTGSEIVDELGEFRRAFPGSGHKLLYSVSFGFRGMRQGVRIQIPGKNL